MCGAIRRVVHVHGSHHHMCARRCRCRSDLLGLGMGLGKRLLAQHRALAGLTGRDHLGGVDRVGTAYDDHVDVGILHHRVDVSREAGATSSRDLFSHTLVDVHHADNVEAVWLTGEHRKVNRLGDQACSEEPDAQRMTHGASPSSTERPRGDNRILSVYHTLGPAINMIRLSVSETCDS